MNDVKGWKEEDRLTLWTKPDELLKSSHGKITYLAWCERERERILQAGGSARIVTREDGLIALFR